MKPAGEPDLVDRLIAMLAERHPDLQKDDLEAFETALRADFGGDRHWVRNASDRAARVARVAALVGQYSEREIARRLGVGKGTVNRLKGRVR